MTVNEAKEIIFEIETRLHRPSRLAKITIPGHILRELNKLGEYEIFKMSLLNEDLEIFFKYKKQGKVEIVSRMIRHGRHKVSVKPYTVDDFINEFNEKIKKKFEIELSLEEDVLILKIDGIKLTTSKWSFYKEAGGGVAIRAEYKSTQRRNKKLFIKYQIKFNEASLYILEPAGDRRRLSTQKVVEIRCDERLSQILFIYKHGDRVKTTSADLPFKPKTNIKTNIQEDDGIKVNKKVDEWELFVTTVLRRGKDYEIVIPRRIFEEFKSRFQTEIFKLTIFGNNLRIDYVWKLSKNREQEISIKELRKGEYRVSIKPYFVEDFIREFNLEAKRKYGIELAIQDNKLILNIDRRTLETIKWMFDREFGGGAYIKAAYPSKIRKEGKITIKYQLKRGKAKLWILEPRNNRRPAVYPIQHIMVEKDRINIIYRHGKRIKTTYIPLPT